MELLWCIGLFRCDDEYISRFCLWSLGIVCLFERILYEISTTLNYAESMLIWGHAIDSIELSEAESVCITACDVGWWIEPLSVLRPVCLLNTGR